MEVNDFRWNTISGKMNLQLDDDVLGCRAGQVVDLDERSSQLSQGTAVHPVQRDQSQLSPTGSGHCCAALNVSFWLWGFIRWHASQCSAVCFMSWADLADAAESTCPIKITLRLNRELNIRHIAQW